MPASTHDDLTNDQLCDLVRVEVAYHQSKPTRMTERTVDLILTALARLADSQPYCAWCEEAESPAYENGEGHDEECPFR